jgi:predicted small lipoprotein YifL
LISNTGTLFELTIVWYLPFYRRPHFRPVAKAKIQKGNDVRMNNMKKMLCFLLAMVIVASLAACGSKDEPAATTAAPEASTAPAVAENAVRM